MNNEIIHPAIFEFERLFLEAQKITEEELGDGVEAEYKTTFNTKNNIVIEVRVFRKDDELE